MQTFLPYSDITESLRVLDDKRLGKQRVETFQIINAITGRPKLNKNIVHHDALTYDYSFGENE